MDRRAKLGIAALLILLGIGTYYFSIQQKYAIITIKIIDPNFGDSIYQKPILDGKTIILERLDAPPSFEGWRLAKGFSDYNGTIRYLPDLPVPSVWKISISWQAGAGEYPNGYKELTTYMLGKGSHRYNHNITIGEGGSVSILVDKKK